MEEILFQSDEVFTVMDFSLTHKVLLIRGTKILEEAGEYISHENIDLLFGGTHFIQIPTWFEEGIIIKKGNSDKIINPQVVLKAGHYFEIINNENTYYIQAGVFEISKNNLNTAESSIDGKKYREPNESIRKEYIEKYPYLVEGLEKYIKTFKESDIWKLWDLSQKKYMVTTFIPPCFHIQEETIMKIIS